MRKIPNACIRFSVLALIATILTACGKGAASQSAPATDDAPAATDAAANEAQPFLQVGEWSGTLSTGAGSAGERKTDDTVITWSSSISVHGRFQLKPTEDPKIPA